MFCSKNGVKSAHGTLTDIVVLSLYPGKRPSRAASSARLNAKKKKKTIGKNVGHKDADNKVLGDRERAQNAGKVRWQLDKMATTTLS